MISRLLQYTLLSMLSILLISCGADNQAQQTDNSTEMISQAASKDTKDINSKYIFQTRDTKGVTRNSAEWVGKQPTVINFWGTWCPPCRAEIPNLIKLYDEYNTKGVEILGLAIPRRESPADVDKFAEQQGMNWQMLLATNEIAVKYEIQSVPTTIFLDKDGNEKERLVGLHDYNSLKAAFEKIM